MDTRIVPGYELRGAHDLLPSDAKDLIRSAAPNAFLIGTWSFDDLEVVTVHGKRYVVVCRRSRGHVDETNEWLYDVDQSKYVLSDRAYGTPFSPETVVSSADTIHEALAI